MPPPNPGRVIDAETNIARRVKLERERRGWSLETTAQAMAGAGCPLHSTAILKIERSDSRRRIQGDEIAAFAAVFELEPGDLFRPVAEIEAGELRARYEEWGRAMTLTRDAQRVEGQAMSAMLDAAAATSNLAERGDLGRWLDGVLRSWGHGGDDETPLKDDFEEYADRVRLDGWDVVVHARRRTSS